MTASVPGARRAALVFIFVTVLIDVLSFGLIIPVLPGLIKKFAGGDTEHAAYWIAVFGTLFAFIQFVCAPIQGSLSDRYGRRPVILLSCLGLGLDFIFMALANTLPWLLVGRVISGITSASFSTANAYIADVTQPEERAKSYGMIGAAFGLGFIIGPVIGGQLGHYDMRLPFWFAAGLALLNFCYGLFVLPESLPPERRSARFDWSHANPVGSLMLLKRYPQVFGLAAVVFIANLAHYVYPSVFVLFADYRYHWKEQEVGFVLGVVGVLSVIVNVVLIGRAVKAFGERRTLLLGLGCGAIGFMIYGFAGSGWMFLVGLPISALWAMAAPATQALITRQVGADVQGRIQGALMSLISLAGIIGPTLFAGSFGYFIGKATPVHLPGVPWFIASSLLVLGVLIAWRYARVRNAPANVVAEVA
ncbi:MULTISPECIES: TCR/Tet family MFS transporter [unclassified Lysobacter]|uniref:TCR/Tet family MFS transporter n=1 Tax=unclassified Lysobacter TaxID=2635362 RepID=UPI0007012446|nr:MULTISPECIES: TCR/Tet family MFS transporter [unclassified Lysobacter]KQZ59253.1 MFS transporter [Lysobacter sp. Root559]KRA75259.1 MFS transporter [Lysobacter sp. Root667]KRC34478.1 MFS transporter [Lysobacter sp. Root76]KRD65784.1 MFS transporter [Lysobacter sp. Root96]